MTTQSAISRPAAARRGIVADKLAEIGGCLELVPMDPHFGGVSVGLYVEGDVCTVWSFSRAEGIADRLREIRDQMVALGGVRAAGGSDAKFAFPCGMIHVRPVKFLLTHAVTKPPSFAHPDGAMTIKDSKSDLMLSVEGAEREGRWAYTVSGEGAVRNPALRLRMVVAGFMRYGEMVKVGNFDVAFPCGERHDELTRLLMPYSRNISAVESMLEAEATRGQMTTGTLGFSPL